MFSNLSGYLASKGEGKNESQSPFNRVMFSNAPIDCEIKIYARRKSQSPFNRVMFSNAPIDCEIKIYARRKSQSPFNRVMFSNEKMASMREEIRKISRNPLLIGSCSPTIVSLKKEIISLY